MLVASLQVEIGGIGQALGVPLPLRQPPQHPRPRRAGVEPHIHRVAALAPLGRFLDTGGGQQFRLVALPPHIRTVLADEGLDVGQALAIEQHLARFAVIKHRDRHPPGALARDAPIAPLPHHRLNAVAAACRQPRHLGDGRQGLGAEALHRGEPLLGGAENGGLFGAPVVGIAVFIALFRQQGAGLLEGVDDRRVGVLEHVEAREGPRFLGEGAGLIHRAQHRQAVLAAGEEVVDAVARGGMHQARARFGGDVVAPQHHRRRASEQRMAIGNPLQFLPFHGEHGLQGQVQGGAQALHQLGCHQQMAAAIAAAADRVVELPVHRHRQVGGQGPGGGGPDRHRQPLAGTVELGRQGLRQRYHREGHVDARGGVTVGILQLRFRKRGARTGAPVHRLEAPVDVPRQHHAAEHLDLGGFVAAVQGEVRGVPVAPDAPAAEALLLDRHLLEGVGVGAAAQLDRREAAALLAAKALQHLQLDRQAVAVPTRHEAGLASVEQGVFVEDVLEDLVEGVAHVQGAVGVRRSVVKGEYRAGVALAQAPVEIQLLPEGLQLRFAHPCVGPHREGGLQQVEGVLVGDAVGGGRGRNAGGHGASWRGAELGLSRFVRAAFGGLAALCGHCGGGEGRGQAFVDLVEAAHHGHLAGLGPLTLSRLSCGGRLSRGGRLRGVVRLGRQGRGLRTHPALAAAARPPTATAAPQTAKAAAPQAAKAAAPKAAEGAAQRRKTRPSHTRERRQGSPQLGHSVAPPLRRAEPLLLLRRQLPPATLAHLHPQPADQQAPAKHRQHRRSGETLGPGDQHQAKQQHHRPPGGIAWAAQLAHQHREQQHGHPQGQGQAASEGGEHRRGRG